MTLTKAIRASMLAGLIATPFSTAMADIQWNGFLSVGGGMTFDDDETFAGYDNDLSFAPDSILGLQASSDLGENLSVTGQLVARGDTSEVKAEWLYLSYQFNPNLRVNIGRQRSPLFFFSDYVDVGYAYHFQRPPTSIYLSPINSLDSVTLLYDRYMGPVEAKLQLFGGSYSENDIKIADVDGTLDLEANDMFGGALTLTYNDWLTLRTSYTQAKITLGGSGYAAVDNIRKKAQDTGYSDIAKAFTEEVDYTFKGVALAIDHNNYLLVAEATERHLEQVDQKQKSYYITAAKRFGILTPYVTVERSETRNNKSRLHQGVTVPPITDPDNLPTEALLAGFVQGYMNSTDRNEYLYSVGMRYDFHPSAALKVQYTHVDDQRDDNLLGVTSRDANLLSFSIDTVF